MGYPVYLKKEYAHLEYNPDLLYGYPDRLFLLFNGSYPFFERPSY